MPKIVFLIGVYGAGKTHLVDEMFQKKIWNKDDYAVVSIDKILIEEAREQGITHNEAFANSIRNDKTGWDNIFKCCELIKKYTAENKNIIVDNPNSTVEVRKRYFSVIPKHYDVEAIYLEIKDVNVYLERLEKRNNFDKSISRGRAVRALDRIEEPEYDEGFSKIETISSV
ncbi:MAG: ATP-binding protein [Lactobacillaceae bacterium]|jgi:adenylate kinase|nr:ATP-binding protein [Lactobacillaceae bacterium]